MWRCMSYDICNIHYIVYIISCWVWWSKFIRTRNESGACENKTVLESNTWNAMTITAVMMNERTWVRAKKGHDFFMYYSMEFLHVCEIYMVRHNRKPKRLLPGCHPPHTHVHILRTFREFCTFLKGVLRIQIIRVCMYDRYIYIYMSVLSIYVIIANCVECFSKKNLKEKRASCIIAGFHHSSVSRSQWIYVGRERVTGWPDTAVLTIHAGLEHGNTPAWMTDVVTVSPGICITTSQSEIPVFFFKSTWKILPKNWPIRKRRAVLFSRWDL